MNGRLQVLFCLKKYLHSFSVPPSLKVYPFMGDSCCHLLKISSALTSCLSFYLFFILQVFFLGIKFLWRKRKAEPHKKTNGAGFCSTQLTTDGSETPAISTEGTDHSGELWRKAPHCTKGSRRFKNYGCCFLNLFLDFEMHNRRWKFQMIDSSVEATEIQINKLNVCSFEKNKTPNKLVSASVSQPKLAFLDLCC